MKKFNVERPNKKFSIDNTAIRFQGPTVIHGDVVYQKIMRGPEGTWEHKIFYVDVRDNAGQTPKIWAQAYPEVRKSIWLAVQPMIMEFVNNKCANGWELVSHIDNYDEILDFYTGTDMVRWVADFVLKIGTGGLTDINAYWTEAKGVRLHFRRRVQPNTR